MIMVFAKSIHLLPLQPPHLRYTEFELSAVLYIGVYAAGAVRVAVAFGVVVGFGMLEQLLPQDLRTENVPERQWRLLQIEAIRKELDLQVIKDAISLTELNQQ
ncbi:MAG: hypothetical protein EZS28_017515, partial [Streblomastix strix]